MASRNGGHLITTLPLLRFRTTNMTYFEELILTPYFDINLKDFNLKSEQI